MALVRFINTYNEAVVVGIDYNSTADLHRQCKKLGHRYEVIRRYI